MRKLNLFIIIGTAMLIGWGGTLWAQAPPISVTVTFDKDYFAYGEPVGVTITATNISGKELLVSKGFSSRLFCLEMRLIDPAGRLLLPKIDQQRTEFPDTPPLPFVLCNGKLTQVAPYEVLSVNWSMTQRVDDLRTYYPIKFPGHYSAEVQLSAMTFIQTGTSGDRCAGDIKNYEWLGVVKSGAKYVSTEGTTEVHIVPNQWHLSWIDDPRNQEIQVQIRPENGKKVDDYNTQYIQLNNVKATSVEVLPSMIKAYFDPKASVESLGQVEVGQWYPVVVSGMFKSGGFFGGGQKVRIHK